MRIAVVGDSVCWGQGLLPQHKFAYIIAQRLGVPFQGVSFQPHSGADIGVGYDGQTQVLAGEIPVSGPTIMKQISQIADPAAYDLVLINGGINDVGVETILNLSVSKPALHESTWKFCWHDMKTLLEAALTAFTNPLCRFRVIGYYPILSNASNLVPADGVDHIEHLLKIHGLHLPLGELRDPISAELCLRALNFWRDSEDALRLAVAETATTFGLKDRIRFVPTGFGEVNALFAPDPKLFGFNLPDFSPQDEVIESRTSSCDLVFSKPWEYLQKEMCHRASVGHPNVAGAAQIADAILATL